MAEPKRTTRVEKATTSVSAPAHSVASNETGHYVITVDATTREISNIEQLSTDGRRRDIAPKDWASLVNDDEVEAMMRTAQDAYTAGLIEGLNLTSGEDADEEFALLQLLRNRSRFIEPEVRLAIERRLLLRRLLSRRLLETS
jgi:hypothetical protein